MSNSSNQVIPLALVGGAAPQSKILLLGLESYFHEPRTSFYYKEGEMVYFIPQENYIEAFNHYETPIDQSGQKKNEENLTKDDIKALYLYTTEEFAQINLKLLSGSSEYDNTIHRINNAIRQAHQIIRRYSTGCYYRVCNFEEAEVDQYQRGMIFYTSQFFSVSRRELDWNYNTLMIIYISKFDSIYACDMEKYSKYTNEKELLLALNSQLEVKVVAKAVEDYASATKILERLEKPKESLKKKGYKYIIVLKLLESIN